MLAVDLNGLSNRWTFVIYYKTIIFQKKYDIKCAKLLTEPTAAHNSLNF